MNNFESGDMYMNIVQWDKELEIGIELLDTQHKEFFINVNKFIIKARVEKNKMAVAEGIDFLINYLLYHFQTEEAFQVTSEYPEYLDHQADHKNISFQVQEITLKLKINEFSDEYIENFYTFLMNWVEQHILKMDLHFSVYYKKYMAESIVNVL